MLYFAMTMPASAGVFSSESEGIALQTHLLQKTWKVGLLAAQSSVAFWNGHRRDVASRALAAIVGGYAFATVLSIFLARALPLPPAEAVMTAMLLSYCLYVGAAIWVFAVRSARRAWLGLVVPTLIFGLLGWILRGNAP